MLRGGALFPGDHGGTMVNRRRPRRPSLRALIRAKRPYFLRHFHAGDGPAMGFLKKAGNWAIPVRDYGPKGGARKLEMGDPRFPDDPVGVLVNRHRARRPPIEAKGALFLTPYPRVRRPGAGVRRKGAKFSRPYPRLGPEGAPSGAEGLYNDSSAISRPIASASGDPLLEP